MKNERVSRRAFLGRTASAAAVFSIVPRYAIAKSGETPPSEKLNVAGIGAGGQAFHDLSKVGVYCNMAALADVDDERAAKAFEKWPDAKKYKDYRVMLEKEKGIDGVVIATPDHIHAPAVLAAMQLGKGVYVEKPMAHTITEVRKLMEAAKKHKVATQMGNQGHSFYGCRQTKTWFEKGVLGDVKEVHCWTNRPVWPQGLDRPTETQPVPATLDWNLWLGPAPERPYNSAYCPRSWRGWYDFGCGALGDMGCHIMDSAFWTLDLGAPSRVSAEVSERKAECFPASSIITYEFPKRGKMPPVTLKWYDGGKMPERPAELEQGRPFGSDEGGCLFVGSKTSLLVDAYGNGGRLLPESKMKDVKSVKVKYPRSPGQHEEWIEACKGGEPAGAGAVLTPF